MPATITKEHIGSMHVTLFDSSTCTKGDPSLRNPNDPRQNELLESLDRSGSWSHFRKQPTLALVDGTDNDVPLLEETLSNLADQIKDATGVDINIFAVDTETVNAPNHIQFSRHGWQQVVEINGPDLIMQPLYFITN